jgi:hypothetical protein
MLVRLASRTASYGMVSRPMMMGSRHMASRVVDTPEKIPQPTEQVPDVTTFLNKIGRNCIEHEKHFDSWEKLMTVSSKELKDAGIDTRDRR